MNSINDLVAIRTQNVFCAAAALDIIYPGWHMRVLLDELDMRSRTKCVLGQVFGDIPDYSYTTMVQNLEERFGLQRATLVFGSPGYAPFWITEINARCSTPQKDEDQA